MYVCMSVGMYVCLCARCYERCSCVHVCRLPTRHGMIYIVCILEIVVCIVSENDVILTLCVLDP